MALTTHLVKNTPDVKQWFSGIDDDYVIDSLTSFIADAEMDYLVPEIGQDTMTTLITGYNANDLAGKMAVLFPYVQKACVHLALMLSSDSAAFRISDSGYYVTSSDTNKPVSDKKLTEFRKARWKAAYKAIEQAIAYLEANVTDAAFTAYADSPQHTNAQKYFINDSITFTNFYSDLTISALTFRMFLRALDWSERTYMLPALGQPLFDDLKSQMRADTLSSDYKKLLPLVQLPLALYTVAKAVTTLQIEFEGKNLLVNSMPAFGNAENVENKAAATPQQVSTLRTDAMTDADVEMKRLQTFLIANAADYPLYVAPPKCEQGDIEINERRSGIAFF